MIEYKKYAKGPWFYMWVKGSRFFFGDSVHILILLKGAFDDQRLRFEIDSGWIERLIKRFAIGRKNWLFADTVEGALASTLLYSLARTAKLNGKNTFEVMTEIFRELPKAQTLEDCERLTEVLLSPENHNHAAKKRAQSFDKSVVPIERSRRKSR